MSLILRQSTQPNTGTDFIKGSALTYDQLDGNFASISQSLAIRPVVQAGPGIEIRNNYISASLRTVNGVSPSNGNVQIQLASVGTGTLAARPSTAADASIYIVSGDPDPASNGDVYIYVVAGGGWQQIAPLDQAAADARYLQLQGGQMQGSINLDNNNLQNVGNVFTSTMTVDGVATFNNGTIKLVNGGGNTIFGPGTNTTARNIYTPDANGTLVISVNSNTANSTGNITISTVPTASFVTASNVWGPYGTGSVVSSSYAVTASYLIGVGSINTSKIFSGSTTIQAYDTGYIIISGSNQSDVQLRISGSLSVGPTNNLAATNVVAIGYASSATASGSLAHGQNVLASATMAHAQGYYATASGEYSHAEGNSTVASGSYSHAEGNRGRALGQYSHAEGNYTTASGDYSHAEGQYTYASGTLSHTEGAFTWGIGFASHAEGNYTTASGDYSHAEGSYTYASGSWSHAEGSLTRAVGNLSHAEGLGTLTVGQYSHAEGVYTTASGNYSHAEGWLTFASGTYSHAEGYLTATSGSYSHAEGTSTIAVGIGSHAEGNGTLASGSYSHAEGSGTTASGSYSHAEGSSAIAIGQYSHAEGSNTRAIGNYSHAEGSATIALGDYSHAEGDTTVASASYSHTEGQGTIASASYQTVVGKYNTRGNTTSLFVVGGGTGTADANRKDILRIDTNGAQVTGSLIVSASTGIVLTAIGTTVLSGSVNTTGSAVISGSFRVAGPTTVSGSLTVTGSIAVTNTLTASNVFVSGSAGTALTAVGSGSTVFTVNGSQGQLFNINDSLSGSLFSVNDISGLPILEVFSDQTTLVGSYLAPALNTTVKKTVNTGVGTVIYQIPTASYDGAWFEYTARSASIAKVGTIMTTWSGSSFATIETTASIGVATAFTMSMFFTGSYAALSGSATTTGWTVKTIVRSI